MGLVTLLNDLTDFKYYSGGTGGKGYTGGGTAPGMKSVPFGESGKPLITFDINNNGKSDVKNIGLLETLGSIEGGDNGDFLLRGGLQAPLRAGIDVSRLTRYLFNPKKSNGLLFTIKQNLLSRISVKTEASRGVAYLGGVVNEGVYTPLSTLAQAGVGFLGIHLNKQGLDPTGLINFLSINTYESIIKKQNKGNFQSSNRLVGLTNAISRGEEKRRFNGQLGYTLNKGNNIIEYGGGPNSILGIGKTKISFADNRINIKNNVNDSPFFNYYKTYSSSNLLDQPKNFDVEIQEDFRKKLDPLTAPTFLSISPNYKTGGGKNIEERLGLGNPGQKGNRSDYTIGKLQKGTLKIQPLDTATSYPIYISDNVKKDAPKDLCQFRIAIIDSANPNAKTYIHFRAFINDFSDGYKSNWKSQKYMGRGEEFYKYDGFNRDISISFTAAAQSKQDLIPMYKKLNYLASTLAPTYTKSGYMAGNLSQMTIGGYLYEQPGFIESLNFDIPQESPWEIGIDTTGETDSTVKELPHIINVNLKFKPIHKFRPSINNIFSDEEGEMQFGQERYIALEDNNGNSYDPPPPPPQIAPINEADSDELNTGNTMTDAESNSVMNSVTNITY